MRAHVDTHGLLPERQESCMSSCMLLPFLVYVYIVYYSICIL